MSNRAKKKNPSLTKTYNTKVRNEHIDYDYLEGLSEEELKFLSKFTDEYYGAVVDVENLENNLVATTPELKKECQTRNNAQNRCEYGIAKASNRLDEMPDNDETGNDLHESVVVDLIHAKRRQERKS